ncbi:hypothetical protein BQ8794_110258 [Mesorhizobium prunaredense]|uniref:Uncharacterized protein n=1 Tax=Mesorhizobium prunaredense TaxID=1631249 RepID=A0A1R3V0P7_9HYPH|nr:hypothetical protein BQ8794_110258 [Mesorhizobium prunaredense]
MRRASRHEPARSERTWLEFECRDSRVATQGVLRFRSGRVENGGFREPERSVLWVREPAHDPEIDIDFGRVMRKIKVLQRPLRGAVGKRS